MALPFEELEKRIESCISSDGLGKRGSNTRIILSSPSDVILAWICVCKTYHVSLDEDQTFNEDIAQLVVLDDYDAGRALHTAYMCCLAVGKDVQGKVSDILRLTRVLADAARDYGGKFPYAKLQKSTIQSLDILCDSHAYIETIINEIGALQPNDNNRKSPPKAQDSSQ
jgi:hypothetical protein